MASDPFAVLLLLGLGVRDISMEASAIGEIRAILSRVTVAEVRQVTEQALTAQSSDDVENGLVARFGERFVDVLVVE
jgi:phosphotransferase system enzyme I (PtsI)